MKVKEAALAAIIARARRQHGCDHAIDPETGECEKCGLFFRVDTGAVVK